MSRNAAMLSDKLAQLAYQVTVAVLALTLFGCATYNPPRRRCTTLRSFTIVAMASMSIREERFPCMSKRRRKAIRNRSTIWATRTGTAKASPRIWTERCRISGRRTRSTLRCDDQSGRHDLQRLGNKTRSRQSHCALQGSRGSWPSCGPMPVRTGAAARRRCRPQQR